VIVHSGHLKDDHLFECYLATRTGEELDPRAAEHLADCDQCVVRYEEVVAFMDTTREAADAETDEEFPAERLLQQQQQILRRLEHVHRSARVITFPGRDTLSGSRSVARLTPRWLAAAAAAGLFIGVAVGGYFGPERFHRSVPRQVAAERPMTVQQRPAAPTAVRVNSAPDDTPDDDAFLMELELALARPHTRELQPFDAMTPHVRDINNQER
jgi:anti-sigma factor RsiW